MKRTTVMLDEEMYARLKGLAQRKGVTSGRMIREAVAAYVVTEAALSGEDTSPLEPLIGIFDLGEDNLSGTMEEFLKATMGKGIPPGAHREHDR